MDLTKLSDSDLDALAAGDFAKLSGEALNYLSTQPDEPAASKDQTTVGERVLQGAKDPYNAVGQLVEKVIPKGAAEAIDKTLRGADPTGLLKGAAKPGTADQAVRDSEMSYQARRGDAAGSFDPARLAGNVLSPLNLSLAAKAASLPAAAGALSRMGVSGGVGGASAGLSTPVISGNPEDFWSEKGKQVGLGAVGGAAAPAVMGALGRIISPRASTNPQVRMLTERGVQPTIGQTLGGLPNRVEQLATSIPITGDAIAAARRRAQNQFQTATINDALSELAGPGAAAPVVRGAGYSAVDEAHQAVSKAYQSAKAQLGHVQLDGQWAQDLAQLKTMSQGLTPPFRRKFDKALNDMVTGRATPQGVLTAETFKRADSDLGTIASQFKGAPAAAAKEYGQAIEQLQALLNQQAYRTNPAAAAAKDRADAAFAKLVRVEEAAGRAINEEGYATPGQFNQAIRSTDRSARKNQSDRGQALMQELGAAGQAVLGNRVPDSGTAGRLAWGVGGLASGAVSPAIPAALIGGAAAYTPPAQRLLRGMVASRPQIAQPIAGALTRAAPLLAPAAGQSALQLSE